MLQVYTEQGYIPIETRKEYYYLQNHSGFNELYFDISIKDPLMKYLINEAVILNEDNRFLIKDVNRRTQNATIKCELDLDEWKQTVCFDTANDSKFQTKTLDEVLNVIKPNGWTISNGLIRTVRRTIDLKDAQPYDILIEAQNVYSIVYDIDVINKIIRVVDPESFKFDGLYATPELNLKGITWQGNSNDFCTRFFAYGKADDNGTPVSIKSVNGGKEYIDDNTYSNKTITKVWRDERYTDPQSLLDDAKKKLKELSVPKMSYDISIIDLQAMNKEYDFLAFGLYKVVKTMIDENTSIEQKVVTYKKYYDKCDQNVITLSNKSQTFTSKVSSILGGSTNEVLNGSFLDQAKKESADIINAFATKGFKYETENETYYLDKLPKEAAKYVMRMNLGGIAFSTNGWSGPYTTAWTIDGRFNADFISTGTLNAIKINAAVITGGSINIQNKFIVDGNGKLKCVEGEFAGTIKGSTITGSTITGSTINGNTISGGTISGTTITGTDINGNTITGGTITGSKIIGSELNTNDQYGTLIIKDGAISYLYYGKLSGKIYLSGITIETGDDIKGKGTLYCTSSIKTDAQILADGNIRGNKGGFFNGEVSARKYNTTSDIRLKENINNVDLESIFDFVHVKSFNYKNSLKRTVGVIAQDFVGTPYEEIIISRNEDGYYSVDYNVFTMALVQEVCRLRQKIKEFEEYKENIEKRLKRLEELHGNNNDE